MNNNDTKTVPTKINTDTLQWQQAIVMPSANFFNDKSKKSIVNERLIQPVKESIFNDNTDIAAYLNKFSFVPPETLYQYVIKDSCILPNNLTFEQLVSSFYEKNFWPNLNNIYINAAAFFKMLFEPRREGYRYKQYQLYFYCLCLIHYVEININSPNLKSLGKDYTIITEWVNPRQSPFYSAIIAGPKRRSNISYDFTQHYSAIMDPKNQVLEGNMIDYLQLSTSQSSLTWQQKTYSFMEAYKNVYYKNLDYARTYSLSISTGNLTNKYIDDNNNLIFNLNNVNFGDTSEQNVIAKYDQIDNVKVSHTVLSRNNLKKLTEIFNMYSTISIDNFRIYKNIYITPLNIFGRVYLIFKGAQVSQRMVHNNIDNGEMKFSGMFTLEGDFYKFIPDNDFISYKSAEVDIKECLLYIVPENNYGSYNSIVPYPINFEVSRSALYNIPYCVNKFIPISKCGPASNNYAISNNVPLHDFVDTHSKSLCNINCYIYDKPSSTMKYSDGNGFMYQENTHLIQYSEIIKGEKDVLPYISSKKEFTFDNSYIAFNDQNKYIKLNDYIGKEDVKFNDYNLYSKLNQTVKHIKYTLPMFDLQTTSTDNVFYMFNKGFILDLNLINDNIFSFCNINLDIIDQNINLNKILYNVDDIYNQVELNTLTRIYFTVECDRLNKRLISKYNAPNGPVTTKIIEILCQGSNISSLGDYEFVTYSAYSDETVGIAIFNYILFKKSTTDSKYYAISAFRVSIPISSAQNKILFESLNNIAVLISDNYTELNNDFVYWNKNTNTTEALVNTIEVNYKSKVVEYYKNYINDITIFDITYNLEKYLELNKAYTINNNPLYQSFSNNDILRSLNITDITKYFGGKLNPKIIDNTATYDEVDVLLNNQIIGKSVTITISIVANKINYSINSGIANVLEEKDVIKIASSNFKYEEEEVIIATNTINNPDGTTTTVENDVRIYYKKSFNNVTLNPDIVYSVDTEGHTTNISTSLLYDNSIVNSKIYNLYLNNDPHTIIYNRYTNNLILINSTSFAYTILSINDLSYILNLTTIPYLSMVYIFTDILVTGLSPKLAYYINNVTTNKIYKKFYYDTLNSNITPMEDDIKTIRYSYNPYDLLSNNNSFNFLSMDLYLNPIPYTPVLNYYYKSVIFPEYNTSANLPLVILETKDNINYSQKIYLTRKKDTTDPITIGNVNTEYFINKCDESIYLIDLIQKTGVLEKDSISDPLLFIKYNLNEWVISLQWK